MLFQRKFKNWRGTWTLWLVLLIAFAYPIQAFIPAFLRIPSTPINAAFRTIYVAMALILIFSSFYLKTTLNKGTFWLLIFWALYSIRLLYDVGIKGISFENKSDFYVYSMVFGNSLLPIIAIILNAKFIEIRKIFDSLYGMVLLSNVLIFYLIIRQNGGLSAGMFLSRISIAGDAGSEGLINSIIIGLYGNLLFILSLFRIMFIQDAKIIKKIIFILPTLLGLLILIIAGSRGPFLNMMLLLIFLFYVKFKDSVSKSAYFFKSIFIILTLYICLAFSGLSDHLTDRFTVFSRLNSFSKTIQKGEKEERNDIFIGAWKQFLSSPIIGDSWVTKKESFYPHNLYLDILMSLGVIGMFIFLIINVDMMKRINFIVKRKEIFILPLSLVLINNFLTGLTSGGIAFSVDLWVLIALFVSFSFSENAGLPN